MVLKKINEKKNFNSLLHFSCKNVMNWRTRGGFLLKYAFYESFSKHVNHRETVQSLHNTQQTTHIHMYSQNRVCQQCELKEKSQWRQNFKG